MRRPWVIAGSVFGLAIVWAAFRAVAAMGDGATSTAGGAAAVETLGVPAGHMLHQRFSPAAVQEAPDFRRHVVPMLGRMGCNSRACHGSFQGQGGFRLSLFGYDFQADHEALAGGPHPRADVKQPAESLVLNHPTTEDHGGGQRFQPGSWQANVLRRWIEGGARGASAAGLRLTRLDVQPAEIVFRTPGQKVPLRATAIWSDGVREDVTDITRFRTNDETIAEVDESGLVTARGKGDTHIIAFYDNGVTPVTVLMPVSDMAGPNYPPVAAPTEIDRLVREKLQKLGILPAAVADDAQFLRRLSLDLTGTLPAPQEIQKFLADGAPDKRARKIDELLAAPAYAAWWTTRFCDWTGDSAEEIADQAFRGEKARQWYQWIYRRLADNVPYDQMVAGILLAVSRTSPQESYHDYCVETSSYLKTKAPAEFAQRETMPHYWTRRNMRQPEDRAISVSYAFLGVRLQCAQCHKHPFDQWTQQDFKQFQAFFDPIRYGVKPQDAPQQREMLAALGVGKGMNLKKVYDQAAEKVHQGQPIPWSELFVAQPGMRGGGKFAGKNPNNAKRFQGAVSTVTPRPLGGDEIAPGRYPDPRVALMEWLRRKDNPYFARAIVNRVWANYFGRGIVEPPDDMNMANPPSNGPLLDYLARQFVVEGYDLKWLHRTILNSLAYQRTWQPNDTNRLDERNFSRMVPRRLPAEVAYDAVAAATAPPQRLDTLHSDTTGRAIGGAVDFKSNYTLTTFGKPARQVICDCERSAEPTLLQTVLLRNDPVLQKQIENSPWLRQIAQSESGRGGAAAGGRNGGGGGGKGNIYRQARLGPEKLLPRQVDQYIDQVFLRTVSRPASHQELRDGRQVVSASTSVSTGIRELLWTMLNTKEFIVNH